MRELVAAGVVACMALVGCGPEASAVAVESERVGTTERFLRVEKALPGRYIVALAEPEGPGALDVSDEGRQLTASHGGRVGATWRHALRGFAVEGLSEAQARALSRHPRVKYVEEDGEVQLSNTQSSPPWGLDRSDQRNLPLSSSYTYNATGSGVNAYIIDSGIRATHTDFGGRVRSGYTGINDGNGTGDCNGHGTHVAGTVGGTTHGIAKQVTLYSVRVFGCTGGSAWSTIISAVDWVTANHVKPAVANLSLGGPATQSMDDALRRMIAAGVTAVVAAGNDGADACSTSPARTPEAITVGATSSTDARASFSNFGSCLDIFAPGVSIRSAWHTGDTATATIQGTSMASPHVAGVAALFLQNNRTATPTQVASALAGNATTGVVTSAGTGSPNRLLFSGFIGGGTPPPTELIIDNDNTRNTTSQFYFQASTNWLVSTSNPPFYGTSYHYASTQAVSDVASFYFNLPAAGTRTVEVWYTAGTNRSTTAPFIVYNASGTELGRVSLNQQLNGGQWVTLGTYNFSAGWNRVALSRWTTAGFVVIADAVRVR
jgi:subtilisin family serine protease